MGRRRFTENEILALTKNRLEDKHLTERLQQIRDAKSILQDENKKETRNLIEVCKGYRRNTGKSPWSRTEPIRSKDGKIDLKDMKKYSKPWAYCPGETTFNVLFQECSYSGRQKTLYLKSQLNLKSSRPSSLKTPVSPRKVITTPRNVQSSVGRFCHLDSRPMESLENSNGKPCGDKKSLDLVRPKSSFEKSDGKYHNAKDLERPKSLSILDKEVMIKPPTSAWDSITENNCNSNNNELNIDNKREPNKTNVLKSKGNHKNSVMSENQSFSVQDVGDIDRTHENRKQREDLEESTAESKVLISEKKVEMMANLLDSGPNDSIKTNSEQDRSDTETNALSIVSKGSYLGEKSLVKENLEQEARPKSKLKKKRSSGKKRVSITTNDMESGGQASTASDSIRDIGVQASTANDSIWDIGGQVSTASDSIRDMFMDSKFNGQLQEQEEQNTEKYNHFETSSQQVLPSSVKVDGDNTITYSNSQQQKDALPSSNSNRSDNSSGFTKENQISGCKKYYSGEITPVNVSKTNNRGKTFALLAPEIPDLDNRPTTSPSGFSAMNKNTDPPGQETSSVSNALETINTIQNVPEISNVALNEHFHGHDFLSFHDEYEDDDDDRDYIVFRGKKIHNYVKPQDRYKHDPFKMKRREKLFKKLAQDTTLVNGDRNNDLNLNLTFSKASRKRILEQLVKENSSSVNQVKINAWDETLPNRIQNFFDSIHPFCNDS